MRVLVTAFCHRIYDNWAPALELCLADGDEVLLASFPRVSDPDSAALSDLAHPRVVEAQIDENFQLIGTNDAALDLWLREAIAGAKPDLIWASGFHVGPESRLMQIVNDLPDRPLVVALQHGMLQNWQTFSLWLDRFDVFGSFGTYFLGQAQADLVRMMQPLSLPKLDRVRRRQPGEARRGKLMYAAQGIDDPEALALFLCDLEVRTGMDVVVRGHPELRRGLNVLAERFAISPQSHPAYLALESVDALVSTGSTVVLEALAAGIPAATIPAAFGEVYADAGLLAEATSGEAVAHLLAENATAQGRDRCDGFLEAVTGGVVGGRARRCLGHMRELAATRN